MVAGSTARAPCAVTGESPSGVVASPPRDHARARLLNCAGRRTRPRRRTPGSRGPPRGRRRGGRARRDLARPRHGRARVAGQQTGSRWRRGRVRRRGAGGGGCGACGGSSPCCCRPRSRQATRRCTAGGRSTTPGSRSPTPAPWRRARARCCSRARRPSRASRTRPGWRCSPSGTGSGCSTTARGSACPTTSPTRRRSRSPCSRWCSPRSWPRLRRCRATPPPSPRWRAAPARSSRRS